MVVLVPAARAGALSSTSLTKDAAAGQGGVRPLSRAHLPAGAAGFVAEGRVAGRILTAPRGAEGFGYDPLFLHPPSGLTFAELPAEAKNTLSHRARAFQALARLLKTLSEVRT